MEGGWEGGREEKDELKKVEELEEERSSRT